MSDRHKYAPISFRPPERDRERLAEHAAQTGRHVNTILADALAAYLDGNVTPVAVAQPKPRRQRPGQAAPVAAELARDRAQDQRGSNCKHEHKLKGWCRECGTGGL